MKSQEVNFSGRGTNNCKDPEARKSSSVLWSRKDATVAEVKRKRGSMGQDVVRGGGRDHTLWGTVNQRKKLTFDSEYNPKPPQGFKLGRGVVS